MSKNPKAEQFKKDERGVRATVTVFTKSGAEYMVGAPDKEKLICALRLLGITDYSTEMFHDVSINQAKDQ